MITEYFRPTDLEEALALLARPELTLPMGGGTVLNAPQAGDYAVVDLQSLSLDDVMVKGKFLEVGATCTLEGLAGAPGLPAGVADVIRLEATQNLRHQATVAGALVAADGRSPLACALLALDAALQLEPGGEEMAYGQMLHLREEVLPGLVYLPGRLITSGRLHAGVVFAFEHVGRSPADRPVVMAAAAAWPSGRLRIAIGGWGTAPRLVIDASDSGGLEEAASSAAAGAGDAWASAEYRQETARVLVRRVANTVLNPR